MFTRVLRISPQGSTTMTMTFDLGNVWRGDGHKEHQLFMPTQPVIQSVAGTVTIRAPNGMTIGDDEPRHAYRRQFRLAGAARCGTPHVSTRFERDTLGRIWWGLKNSF